MDIQGQRHLCLCAQHSLPHHNWPFDLLLVYLCTTLWDGRSCQSARRCQHTQTSAIYHTCTIRCDTTSISILNTKLNSYRNLTPKLYIQYPKTITLLNAGQDDFSSSQISCCSTAVLAVPHSKHALINTEDVALATDGAPKSIMRPSVFCGL